jgi:hypothetical protein
MTVSDAAETPSATPYMLFGAIGGLLYSDARASADARRTLRKLYYVRTADSQEVAVQRTSTSRSARASRFSRREMLSRPGTSLMGPPKFCDPTNAERVARAECSVMLDGAMLTATSVFTN